MTLPITLDATIQDLFSNALFSLLVYSGEKIITQIQNKNKKNNIWGRVAGEVSDYLEKESFDNDEKLISFLKSPEIESIVRQLYSVEITRKTGHYESIENEFGSLLALYLNTPPGRINNLRAYLFSRLKEGCQNAITIAIDSGSLSAHDAQSNMRFNLLYDEIATIKKNIEALLGRTHIQLSEISEFEKNYRTQVANRHSYITPPTFDSVRRIPIDKIYVDPSFTKLAKVKKEKVKDKPDTGTKEIRSHDLLSSAYRLVILGNPGGGKSTFSLKICHDIASKYTKRYFAGRLVTPILVILRDYGAEKKTNKCSLLEFIEITSNSKYQIKPPVGAFEYLLLNGHAMVIFDGLDELLDSSYRQEITSDVESFCTLYPSVPVIVTSREVGYEQAPLDPNKFEIFHLASFNDDQVRKYVENWFYLETDLPIIEQKNKIEAFLNESQIAHDIRSNPLMLSLMCNIYRGENYIPKNRPDVYEKCATMLFDRWDKQRGIHHPLPFDVHIRPTMMYLAHWIYSDEKLQVGVAENKLVSKATEYLYPRRYENQDEAENAARDFIGFCRGRAWVFTDMGLTKDGERLYLFTHRTFLEYFTACFLSRNYASPNEMWGFLKPKIAKREWDIVSQLAIQIQNKNIEGAGDKLLQSIIDEADNSDLAIRGNHLHFAVRCLGFLVPSPKLLRIIIGKLLNYLLQRQEKSSAISSHHAKGIIDNSSIVQSILQVADENQYIAYQCVRQKLIDYIKSNEGNVENISYTFDLANVPSSFLGVRDLKPNQYKKMWEDLQSEVLNECRKQIIAVSKESYGLSVDLFTRGELFIDSIIKEFGIKQAFLGYYEHPAYRGISIAPMNLLLIALLSPLDDWRFFKHIERNMTLLSTNALLRDPLVVSENEINSFYIDVFDDLLQDRFNRAGNKPIEENEEKYAFKFILLNAVYWELHHEKEEVKINTFAKIELTK